MLASLARKVWPGEIFSWLPEPFYFMQPCHLVLRDEVCIGELPVEKEAGCGGRGGGREASSLRVSLADKRW